MARSEKRLRKRENARAAREAREVAVKRARRNRMLVRVAVVLVVFAAVVALVSVLNDDDTNVSTDTPDASTTTVEGECVDTVPEVDSDVKRSYDAEPELTVDKEKVYVATIATSCGEFKVGLDVDNAPRTVNSFVFLAREGFYDGLTWHRIVKDFVIQGGDPNGDGTGDPGYSLPDEPPPDGYGLGSVAMANGGAGTTGSQFFVVLSHEGGANLGGPPYGYSTLGTVLEGGDVVLKLASFANPDEDPNDISTQVPTRPLYIFSVEIEES